MMSTNWSHQMGIHKSTTKNQSSWPTTQHQKSSTRGGSYLALRWTKLACLSVVRSFLSPKVTSSLTYFSHHISPSCVRFLSNFLKMMNSSPLLLFFLCQLITVTMIYIITHQLSVKHSVLCTRLHSAQWSLIWHETTKCDPTCSNYFKLCIDMKLMGRWLATMFVTYIYILAEFPGGVLSSFCLFIVVVVKWTCSPISPCIVICSKRVRRSMALCGIVLGKLWHFMHHVSGMPTVNELSAYATFHVYIYD